MKFELRKIMDKRRMLLSIAVIVLLSGMLSFSTLQNMYAFDGVSNEGSGRAAVEIDKAIADRYKGILTDHKVQQMLSDFRPTYDLQGMNAQYLYQNATQSAAFSRFSDENGNWNGASVSDVFGEEAIKIGYVNGWLHTSTNMAKTFVVLSLVIIFMVSPVLSREYQGVDNIILTSKCGKTKCATAKVIASLLSAFFVTIFVVIFHLAVFYGIDGLDCSILFAPQDFAEGYITIPMTCAVLLKYQILLVFTSVISVTGITLALFAACKSPMVVFAVSAAIHVLPVLLPVHETSPLYKLVVLMPFYQLQYISILSVEPMENGMFYAIWAVPFAGILIVLGAVISRRIFAKHQVS